MAADLLEEEEVLLSNVSFPVNSDSEDDSAVKSTKIELQECHLRNAPVEEDGILHRSACGSIYVVCASIMASLGGVLFGYDIGIISGAVLQLRDEFCLSCSFQEMVISAMLMGAIAGSLIGGFLIDKFGRRLTIIVNTAVFLVGALVLGFSPNYAALIIGRLLLGFAVSLSATGECIYISEIAPPKRRGQLVSLNELGITLGLLMAYLVNYLFIDVPEGWRYMFSLSAIPAAIQGVGMFFLPKSPRYLVLMGRDAEAEDVLLKLRDRKKIQAHRELEKIKSSISTEKEHTCLDLFSSSDNMAGRMFIGAGLVFFQQCTGQPNVLYYAPTLFEGIGFESDSAATLATVGLGCVKVVMTVITICCVDKWGRRRFLLTGASLMGVSLLLLGIISHLNDHVYGSNPCQESVRCSEALTNANFNLTMPYTTTPQMFDMNESYTLSELEWMAYIMDNYTITTTEEPHVHIHGSTLGKIAAFTSLMLYVAAFGFSFGPVSWLILSEIFPASVRGRAISLATVLNWGTNLIVSLTFLDIIEKIGVSWTFVMFSAVCGASVIFIFVCVPETRGKSLEQISKELNNRSLKSRIAAYCRRLHCCVQPFSGSPAKLPNYHRVQSSESFNDIS
ncbi:solute carrier family 2, facilitated glucose transporter member 12-like isoform X2 [Ostrea edulis]|uniref:solute carrier family 2, facilitated glucose transporter member 12-like isoform X2 n=1 Tax=Ostrea edulis TaxID=37623 RepID=UPI002095750D|nr:solute carrier family 2, facilitated glucose transporter member 12-like isoform X2 [Ostrea edulis]XP_048760031.1 solute carrier family 2, facilitated glucose transporter member 12-like isoform X2 [Ostrea edulis]XP_048760034.1 solute carrier family 2, facilitated glucose transporter member 12-like isoform X2 [Ostrea edulis]XP_048760035.1 solute carrier family 2, facilitated glucose transporter member 12-like isoform X2 [Ostrea edulis]XP_056019761.1 solute carrier family 2, facilitated glucose